MSDDKTRELAAELATGLRAVADMIEANPELADGMRYFLSGINIPVNDRATMAAFVRAGKAHGAKITKSSSATDKYFSAALSWGRIGLDIYAERERVCERVVVGTETVTSKVPDPDLLAKVPEVEVTEEREIVEWRCSPLLASGSDGAA